jgi:patatin-like phospholipase/acyl hydrolase
MSLDFPDHRSRWSLRDSGKVILSLDGGGMRGLSSLFVLRRIMEGLRDNPEHPLPLPCQYFDLVCGTGTGGLIALMLGRLRMVKSHLDSHANLLAHQRLHYRISTAS